MCDFLDVELFEKGGCLRCGGLAVFTHIYKYNGGQLLFVHACDTCLPVFTEVQCISCCKLVKQAMWRYSSYNDPAIPGRLLRMSFCSIACIKDGAVKLKVVLRDQARSMGLTQGGDRTNGVCNKCLKVARMKKCARCTSVYYCSRRCQTEDWVDHKKECM